MPFHQKDYYNGLNWVLKAPNEDQFYTGGSFERFFTIRAGLRNPPCGPNSEYFSVSHQCISEIHSFSALINEQYLWIGGINIIHIYERQWLRIKHEIDMPDWVIKMYMINPRFMLCIMRNSYIGIVDTKTFSVHTTSKLLDPSLNDLCPLSFKRDCLKFALAGSKGLYFLSLSKDFK